MEVEAPLPCTEAAGRALLRSSGRWTDRYFFKNPILLLGPKEPPADILSDDNHEKSTVDITNWEECYTVKLDSIDWGTSEELMLTGMVSTGGLDNYIGSQVHVDEHLSTVDPVLKMLASIDPAMGVFRKDEYAFCCHQKSMLPEEELGMDQKSVSSLLTKQAPLVFTKCYAPSDGRDSFVQECEGFFGVTTHADNQQVNERNVEHNQMFKQSKMCSVGSGSNPNDDIDKEQQQHQQQQQQQHQQQQVAAMNWMNIPGSMNYNKSSGSMTISRMALKEQRPLKDTCQTHQGTDGATEINFTEQKGEPDLHRNRIWAITCFLSIFGSSIISTALKNAPGATATRWIVASAAPHHATGNRALLSDFAPQHSDIFLLGGEAGAKPMQVAGRGAVVTETTVLPDVWYVPGLVSNLVSVSQLAELDYSVAFGRGKCYIRSTADGGIIGAAHAGEDGLFALDFLRVPLGL